MRTALTTFAWIFVLAVAVYDAFFAWHHRFTFELWELNPVAVWVAHLYGLRVVILAKFLVLTFAASVAVYCHHRRHPLEVPYSLLIGLLHAGLWLHYCFGGLLA
jgi:hypothetical protein